jgi:hypothetical protein
MAISAAKKGGQGILGGYGAIQDYDLTLDDSWLAAGKAVDLSDDFATIDSIQVSGVVAGIGVNFMAQIPASGVAVTSSNVLIMAYWSTDATGAMTAVPDTTDLQACNPLTITVKGKPKVAS